MIFSKKMWKKISKLEIGNRKKIPVKKIRIWVNQYQNQRISNNLFKKNIFVNHDAKQMRILNLAEKKVNGVISEKER